MEKFNLSGICGKKRHEGLNKIEQTVNKHGYIIDLKGFQISLLI